MQTHKRPDLREPIRTLLGKLIGVVRAGGDIPLTELVTAVAGSKLAADVRVRLDARGDVSFVHRPTGEAHFSNEGPETRIELKRFAIKIPRRLRGDASIAGERVDLRFDRAGTLTASKLLLSIKLERVTLDEARVVVSMESKAFDQCFELE